MHRCTIAVLVASGCMGGESDGRHDSFGGRGAKADGLYSSCQLAEVLKFVNESTTTIERLREARLPDEAAKAIVAHRHGPDRMPGTGDDDVFDDLDELDSVDYVGALALGRLVEAILPRCEIDLASRPFIDTTTFAGAPGGGWSRDNQEVESVLGVTGITGQRLRSLLLERDSNGRTLYTRLRKARIMEAFTYDYPLDEIPWDAAAMAARERMPYVALTIEGGRFNPDASTGRRELSLGTDLMDDIYYDTPGYSLLAHEIQLRGRARWDNATTLRRLLIAAKFDTQIDAAGNKTNAKVDVRTDNGMRHLATLDEDVRRGKVAWSGSDTPVVPIKGVYEQLASRHVLPDIGGHQGVLLLDPKAHLRSTRSRYHMNEASIASVRRVYQNGATRLTALLDTIARAKAAGTIPAAQRARVDALQTMVMRVLDNSLLAERITAAGVPVTAATLVLPDAQAPATTPQALANHRIIAETIDGVLHEIATSLDAVDRFITNAGDASFDVYAETFRDWRLSVEPSLRIKTTWDAFLAAHASLSSNGASSLAAFNTFATAAGRAPLDDAGWTRLGGYLERMVLTVAARQLETAGIAARQLWFDQARTLWVPGSDRAWSNFMIDTMDMTEMLSHEEWLTIPEAARTFAEPLPAAKVLHTVLVNELQIELGSEEAYVARLKDLTEKLAASPGDASLRAELDGATFVWEQYTGAMKVLTELKGDNVLSRLRRAGAPQSVRWSAPPDSKGNQALKILADRD
jgi:hypothetical protein